MDVRRLALVLLLGMIACRAATDSTTRDTQFLALLFYLSQTASYPRFLYVPNAASNDISIYAINRETGYLSNPVQAYSTATISASPMSAIVESGNRFVYVARNAGAFGAVAYVADQTTGALTYVNEVTSLGNAHRFAVNSEGTRLYLADAGGGRVLVLGIDQSTGALTVLGSTIVTANSQFIAIHPSGRALYVANSGGTTIQMFSIDTATGLLTFMGTLSGLPNGVSQLAINQAGTFMYTSGNTTTIRSVSIDQSTYTLSLYFGATVATNTGCTLMDGTKRYLYANTIGGSQTIYQFIIDPVTGIMTANGTFTGLKFHDCGCADSLGRFLYYGDVSTPGNISMLRIDPSNGTLSDAGSVPAGSNPRLCSILNQSQRVIQ